mmetsp:Transcript_21004/g.45134  ORF Transcript_21004/g.45134 Transcript_21004/m.45134 type:complete len:153 (-) Transcript_21004:138-596(-)
MVRLAAPWSIVGMAALVGMLAVDAVFDFGANQFEVKSYYCALLPTLFSFPALLRVLVPVAFSGSFILYSLFTTRSFWHICTCFCLICGGLPCFYTSISTVSNICSAKAGTSIAVQVHVLGLTHIAMALVFAGAIFTEVMGQLTWTEARDKTD